MAIGLIAYAAALAQPTATWQVSGAPGAVTAVTGRVKTGGRIVADGFVADRDRVSDERATFPAMPTQATGCTRAAAARPFTRQRRFAASGRLLWEWRVNREEQALRFNAVGNADCLSPDGGRLTVAIYRIADGEPVTRLGEGVIAVDHRPRFVEARGVRTHQVYGGSHDTGLIGWRLGKPATLMFEIERGEAESLVDEAVMSGPRRAR